MQSYLKYTLITISLAAAPAMAEYYLYTPIPVETTVEVINLGSVVPGTQISRYVAIKNTSSEAGVPTITTTAPLEVNDVSCQNNSTAPGQFCYVKISTTMPNSALSQSFNVHINNQNKRYDIKATLGKSTFLQLNPSTIDFGAVSLGGTAQRALTLVNTSSEDIDISTLKVPTGIATEGCDTVPSLGQCTLNLTWVPKTGGALSKSITYSNNIVGYVSGYSQSGTLQWNQSTLAANGSIGEWVSITGGLTNIGDGSLNISKLETSTPNVKVVHTNCDTSLESKSSCQFELQALIQDQAYAAQLRATTADSSSSVQVQVSPKTINKVLTAYTDKATLTADNLHIDTTSLILQNNGQASINVSNIESSTPNILIKNKNNCIGALLPKQECTLSVEYKPSSPFPSQAKLTITSDANEPETFVNLTLEHQYSKWLSSQSSLQYGINYVPVEKPLSTILTNVGNTPSKPSLTSGFLKLSGCTTLVAPGESCEITATYKTTTPHTLTDSVLIQDPLAKSILSVPAIGTAILPPNSALAINTSSCTSALVGQTSQCQTLLTNATSQTITLSNFRSEKHNDALISNNCANSLAPGAQCVISFSKTYNQVDSLPEKVVFEAEGELYSTTGVYQYTPYVLDIKVSAPAVGVNTEGTGQISITNKSALSLKDATHSIAGPFYDQQNTCSSTLMPNVPCTITFKYKSTQSGTLTGEYTLTSSLANDTAPISVDIYTPTLSITAPAGIPPYIAGYSNSGILRRITNNTASNVSIKLPLSAGVNTPTKFSATGSEVFNSLRENSTVATTADTISLSAFTQPGWISNVKGCVQNITLSPGMSCDYLENPEIIGLDASYGLQSRTVNNTHYIQTSIGPVKVPSIVEIKTPSAIILPYDKVVYPGTVPDIQVEATNPTSDDITLSVSGYQVQANIPIYKGNSCGALNTLPANKTCILTFQNTKKFSIAGSQWMKVSDVPLSKYKIWWGTSAVLNSASLLNADIVLTNGTTNSDWTEAVVQAQVPQSDASATQVFTNTGTLAITLTKDVAISPLAPNTGFEIVSSQCKAGTVLLPNESCSVGVKFNAPTLLDTGKATRLRAEYTPKGSSTAQYKDSDNITLTVKALTEYTTSPIGNALCPWTFVMDNQGRMICASLQAQQKSATCTSTSYSDCALALMEPMPLGAWTTNEAKVNDVLPGWYASHAFSSTPRAIPELHSTYSGNYTSGLNQKSISLTNVSIHNNQVLFAYGSNAWYAKSGTASTSQGFTSEIFKVNADTYQHTKQLTLINNLRIDELAGQSTVGGGEVQAGSQGYWLKNSAPTLKNGMYTFSGSTVNWRYFTYAGANTANVSSATHTEILRSLTYGSVNTIDKSDDSLIGWIMPTDNATLQSPQAYRITPSGQIQYISIAELPFKVQYNGRVYTPKFGPSSGYVDAPSFQTEIKNGIALRAFTLGPNTYLPSQAVDSTHQGIDTSNKVYYFAVDLNSAKPSFILVKIDTYTGVNGSFKTSHLAHEYDGNLYFNDGTMLKWQDIQKMIRP
jgi:hypothetical protein